MKYKIDMIEKAKRLAEHWHDGQTRKDGITKYIVHPFAVVALLKEWGVNDNIIISAAYCHDLIEDTEIGEKLLKAELGEDVLRLVKELSIPVNTEKQIYLDRLALKGSAGALLVKTADRVCNTRDFLSDKKFKSAFKYYYNASEIYSKLSDFSEELGDEIIRNAMKTLMLLEEELSESCEVNN